MEGRRMRAHVFTDAVRRAGGDAGVAGPAGRGLRRFYRRLRAKGRSKLLIISAFSFLLFGCLVAYTSVAGEV